MVHLTTALEPGSGVPLYEQLYRSLAGEMRTGALPAGTRMPGKRRLAAELSVSVNTVDTAYQMLAAEGYLAARERSGFYVQEYLALPQVGPDARGPSPAPAVPEPAAPEPPVRYDLSTRGVDPGLFPFRTWARLQKELLYSSPELLTNGDAQGDLALRQALADYLAEYRGVQCGAHQVVVGAGLEYLLGLLAPLLHGTAAVETPGYPRALQVLENTGMRCCCLPVDEGGLSLDALDRSGAAVCYVTPSHQFPTGVTMPAGRRAELLHWAARRPGQRYIIEDDYDSEFRFDTRPLPSLQGMAGADGPVVYLSTCSRSLAPGIRIAYMVLPEHLLPAWHAKYRLYSGTVSRFEQQTLARFITGGKSPVQRLGQRVPPGLVGHPLPRQMPGKVPLGDEPGQRLLLEPADRAGIKPVSRPPRREELHRQHHIGDADAGGKAPGAGGEIDHWAVGPGHPLQAGQWAGVEPELGVVVVLDDVPLPRLAGRPMEQLRPPPGGHGDPRRELVAWGDVADRRARPGQCLDG